MKKFGLIGFPLGHSFSKKYFTNKFEQEGITSCSFDLYEIPRIGDFPLVLKENPELKGMSVTIPYKQEVIPFLDHLDSACASIGAVNCIKISSEGLKGYNTDYIGFKSSLVKWLQGKPIKAVVLGTGGASKAVKEALKDLNIEFVSVSRTSGDDSISYAELAADSQLLRAHHLIINTTPLGTFPAVDAMPEIPVDQLNSSHLVFDLVYNPPVTQLMKVCLDAGGKAQNGLEMLELQAEAAWEIWNE